MTTVSRSSLSDTFSKFIRDVLRENLTDTQSPARSGSEWVFKSEPEDLEWDPPYVILDNWEVNQTSIGVGRTKRMFIPIAVEIVVWARKNADRDTLSDEIIETLNDYTNTDGTNSIASQNLFLDRSTTRNEDDDSLSKFPKILRGKRLLLDFSYGGA